MYAAMLFIQVCYYFIEPPKRYPYIREMLFALLGFVYFGIVYLYMHWKMWIDYKSDMMDPTEKIKLHND